MESSIKLDKLSSNRILIDIDNRHRRRNSEQQIRPRTTTTSLIYSIDSNKYRSLNQSKPINDSNQQLKTEEKQQQSVKSTYTVNINPLSSMPPPPPSTTTALTSTRATPMRKTVILTQIAEQEEENDGGCNRLVRCINDDLSSTHSSHSTISSSATSATTRPPRYTVTFYKANLESINESAMINKSKSNENFTPLVLNDEQRRHLKQTQSNFEISSSSYQPSLTASSSSSFSLLLQNNNNQNQNQKKDEEDNKQQQERYLSVTSINLVPNSSRLSGKRRFISLVKSNNNNSNNDAIIKQQQTDLNPSSSSSSSAASSSSIAASLGNNLKRKLFPSFFSSLLKSTKKDFKNQIRLRNLY